MFAASDMRAEAAVGLDEDAPTPAEAPVIMLGPLENKSFVDELSDGVQSMDVRWDNTDVFCSHFIYIYIYIILHIFQWKDICFVVVFHTVCTFLHISVSVSAKFWLQWGDSPHTNKVSLFGFLFSSLASHCHLLPVFLSQTDTNKMYEVSQIKEGRFIFLTRDTNKF